MDDLLLGEQTLFKNQEVFDPSYIPDHVLFRENQMRSLRFSILPAVRGGRPVNTLCVGPVATGKTTVIRKVFAEVEDEVSNVIPVYVNCQSANTRYLVVSQVYTKIFGHSPPSSGVPLEKIFAKIAKKLVDEGKSLVVALDDIQSLFREGEINRVLYSLLKAHETYEGVKIGVSAVYSGERMEYELDHRVYSIFMPEEIRFQPYSKEEIREILDQRVRAGFYPGVMCDDALEKIVEVAYSMNDLRVGIDLLLKSGLNAEKRASKKITVEDVEKACEKSMHDFLLSKIRGLSKDELELLKMICSGEERAGELQRRFEEVTGARYTKFHELLKSLESKGLIKLEMSGKGYRGRSRIPRVCYDAEELLEKIRSVEKASSKNP